MIHVPTAGMLADGLTKIGTFPQLMAFATTGRWKLPSDMIVRVRRREPTQKYSEADLEATEW